MGRMLNLLNTDKIWGVKNMAFDMDWVSLASMRETAANYHSQLINTMLLRETRET